MKKGFKPRFKTKDSGKRVVFKTGMNRDVNEGKIRYDLVIPLDMKNPMLRRWAELMTRGAKKYTPRNWEKARTQEEFDRFRESAIRHFMQWFEGNTDEDHASAVLFNIQGAELVKERLHKK